MTKILLFLLPNDREKGKREIDINALHLSVSRFLPSRIIYQRKINVKAYYKHLFSCSVTP